jgi:hypothetical protein
VLHQPRDVRLARDIDFDRDPADLIGNLRRRCGVEVGDHDGLCTVCLEPPAQRAADPVSAARHDHDFAGYLHGTSFYEALLTAALLRIQV